MGDPPYEREAAKGHPLWLTITWLTVGVALWIVLRHALWFVGFMSLYAIWITYLAGWAAEHPSSARKQARRLRRASGERLVAGRDDGEVFTDPTDPENGRDRRVAIDEDPKVVVVLGCAFTRRE